MGSDQRTIIEALGGEEAVARMDHEGRADALEDYLTRQLEDAIRRRKGDKPYPTVEEHAQRVESRVYRRGAGSLFLHKRSNKNPDEDLSGRFVHRLAPMSSRPTLVEFFEKRFAPAAHLLQSARLARQQGCSEEVVLACLLHDMGGILMKTEHGHWGAQLIEPYVSARVAFAVRYHQALRFFPDPSVGYEYPSAYYTTFGIDYVPPVHIKRDYEYARNHKWYMDARHVTLNDLYSFDPSVEVPLDEFRELLAKHFRDPEEGLGFDNSPVSHMWRSLINPDSPL